MRRSTEPINREYLNRAIEYQVTEGVRRIKAGVEARRVCGAAA